ncbi:glycosyltransferase family 2 protein [Proteus terrae]|uniref:glycosyltransferase family 2 protein n=1 Tax=Proteus terrae TaxID=1574161 RepID=UPI00288BBE9B|nr:glycosyltransferase family 2 protein [Proteus terrae]
MKKKNYLVSVIMPCFDSELYLADSIKSVLNQTYQNFELIIIDDNSKDSTLKIANSFNDDRITIISFTENKGAGAARNKGIELAKGRFIAFLDSDDLWNKQKLEIQVEFMLKNNYHLTYSYYQCFNKNGISNTKTPPLSISYKKLLYCNVIGCLTAVYDIHMIGKQYMPIIRKRQDMGLWLKILKNYGDAYCIPRILAYYRTDSGMTKNKLNAALYQWKFYRYELKFNLMKSLYYFIGYTYNGVFKK